MFVMRESFWVTLRAKLSKQERRKSSTLKVREIVLC